MISYNAVELHFYVFVIGKSLIQLLNQLTGADLVTAFQIKSFVNTRNFMLHENFGFKQFKNFTIDGLYEFLFDSIYDKSNDNIP